VRKSPVMTHPCGRSMPVPLPQKGWHWKISTSMGPHLCGRSMPVPLPQKGWHWKVSTSMGPPLWEVNACASTTEGVALESFYFNGATSRNIHNTTSQLQLQHKTTQHKKRQHNTTQHNTTQHNTTQHNTTQHNTTQHTLQY